MNTIAAQEIGSDYTEPTVRAAVAACDLRRDRLWVDRWRLEGGYEWQDGLVRQRDAVLGPLRAHGWRLEARAPRCPLRFERPTRLPDRLASRRRLHADGGDHSVSASPTLDARTCHGSRRRDWFEAPDGQARSDRPPVVPGCRLPARRALTFRHRSSSISAGQPRRRATSSTSSRSSARASESSCGSGAVPGLLAWGGTADAGDRRHSRPSCNHLDRHTCARCRELRWRESRRAGRPDGTRRSVVGAADVFDLLRFDVARGFRDGRWSFSVDVITRLLVDIL